MQVLDDGVLRTVAVTHTDPAKVAFARDDQRALPGRPRCRRPACRTSCARGSRSSIPTSPRRWWSPRFATRTTCGSSVELGLTSLIIVPLTTAGTTFGTMSLVSAESGRHFGPDDLAFVEDLARRAAVAVANAEEFRRQKGRLAEITRIAEVVQHAILPPVPRRAGNLNLCTSYVSAAREALVGGDLYEIVAVPGAVRLIIGDVRGKGLDAVRLATVVLGEFRAAAVERDDITALARQMDARMRPYLGDEDFVTALIAEIDSNGLASVVCCGHPPALLFTGGERSLPRCCRQPAAGPRRRPGRCHGAAGARGPAAALHRRNPGGTRPRRPVHRAGARSPRSWPPARSTRCWTASTRRCGTLSAPIWLTTWPCSSPSTSRAAG